MIYKVVPQAANSLARRDSRRHFWPSLLWEAGRQALAAYLLHLNYPSAYGIIGSFIAVMLWAYYAALVILFGAEYVRVIAARKRQAQQEKHCGRWRSSRREQLA